MENELRIVMLEDLEEDVGLIERTLKKEGLVFKSMRVDTRDEFIAAIRTFDPDIILSDHALPQFNSLEALTICKKLGLNLPFILVTGTVSEEFAVSCLKQGADDYVLKSNLTRLPTAIMNALRQRQIELERQKAEKALRMQNEELVKINKELDSFVYSVSHNLRAPLMSVLGLISLAKMGDKEANSVFEQYFGMMEHSIHKLDDTLKEILDYSRNARSLIKNERVEIKRLIEDVFERLKYLEGSEQVQKNVEVEGECVVNSDPYRLNVIFNNLISNAIKYRDPAKEKNYINIRITVSEEMISIKFSDNGIGIGEQYQPKIFDMFFRATEKSEGAGLGLYIVKETVEKLGGTVYLESSHNVGTEFSITLPNKKDLSLDSGEVEGRSIDENESITKESS